MEDKIKECVKHNLLALGHIKERQQLCLTPVDKNKELLKVPPRKWEEVQKGNFMIINAQHSIQASKDLQQEKCSETRRTELRTWEAYIVWTLDASKLVNISEFYNLANHLEHAQPTWGN